MPADLDLRRAVLAVSVLHDVDVAPDRLGVGLPGSPVHLPWSECRTALRGTDPATADGRDRLASWVLARRWAADLPPVELGDLLRPVGLPVGHALHPGPEWVRERVLGGALELGFGAAGLDPADPDAVVLLPPAALEGRELDLDLRWREAHTYLADMGALAVRLLRPDSRGSRDARGQLRPIGDCDVVTLLGARPLRAALAEQAGGMAAAVVPMRTRGWTRLTGIDPAFGPAAAAATDPVDRGFERPLLLTADEVTLVSPGGSPASLGLGDPGRPTAGPRQVRYL